MVLRLASRLVVESIAGWKKVVHEGSALRGVFRIIVSGLFPGRV